MKKYNTIENEINGLKDKGMLFKDEDSTKKILLKENYYNIIDNYEEIFLNLKENFVDETYFEELYAIYKLDKGLKDLLLDYITIFETNIKSYIGYTIEEEYGNGEIKRDYLDNDSKIDRKYDKFMNIIKDNISRLNNKNKNALFYKENGYLPPLRFVNVMTLGNTLILYHMLKMEDKQKIAGHYYISPFSLEKFLNMLNEVRNICAHGGVLLKYRSTFKLSYKENKYHKLFNIKNSGINDFFSIIIIFKYVLEKDDFNNLYLRIVNLLTYVKNELDIDSYNNLLNMMGIPNNYLDLFENKTEKESNYKPNPIDASNIVLNDELINLEEKLAQNIHEIWAKSRIDEGWKYGTVRDDKLKTTPDLVSYDKLTEEEKDYDRNTAMGTLKLILKLGYDIKKEK